MINDGNGEYVFLLGDDNEVWQKTPLRDLVALYAREYEDPISNWITETALSWYHTVLGRHIHKVSSPPKM